MSDIKSISVTDTAKLIRTSLREAFPGVKFGVRAQRYAFGASIHVTWCDGPNTLQVEAITRRFAAAYHDTASDSWRPLWHRLHGERVSFGAPHVFCQRQHSDAWCAEAFKLAYEEHCNLLTAQGIEVPSLLDVYDDPNGPRHESMLYAAREVLRERTECPAPATSATALSVTLLAGDNPAVSLVDAGWARPLH